MTHRFIALAASALVALIAPTANAYPPGFFEFHIGGTWNNATGLTFDETGRMFVWEKGGTVWIVENGVRQPSPIINIFDEVGDWRDHGLLGVALDPGFLTNGHIYLLYVVDRYHLFNADTPGYNEFQSIFFNASIGRVTRYTIDTTTFDTLVPDSRTVLIGETRQTGIPIIHESHGVGSIFFGTDGSLLITTGDAASFVDRDNGGNDGGSYAIQAIGDGILNPITDVGSFRSQVVDSLNGKVLRIDPDTGDGIPSNPWYDDTDPRAPRSRVFALGLRNPFRAALRPNTGSHVLADAQPGDIYVGDVGWGEWEEINVVTEARQNFGWPLYEGMEYSQAYANVSPFNLDAIDPVCGPINFTDLIIQDQISPAIFPRPCAAGVLDTDITPAFKHERPRLDWNHWSPITRIPTFSGNTATTEVVGNSVPGAPFNGFCVTGGAWYTGTNYPAEYTDTYFAGDFVTGRISNLVFDADNDLQEVRNFHEGPNGIVAFAQNPVDGFLYMIRYGNSVFRLNYAVTGNTPPTPVASADVNFGPSPLAVNFSSAGTLDAQGDPIDYLWDFGDGNTSTDPNPTHVFTSGAVQQYDVELTATDDEGSSASTTIIVSINNTPPSVTITSPPAGFEYSVLQPTIMPLQATITDTEHTAGELTCEWRTVLHHNNHTHPEPVDTNCDTSAVVTPVGCDGETYFFRFTLTVTDAAGLSTTQHVDIHPDCAGDCLCEYGGDPDTVDVTDLLAYLGPWFNQLPEADLDDSGTTDVVDLLSFLECWFPTSNGSPCP